MQILKYNKHIKFTKILAIFQNRQICQANKMGIKYFKTSDKLLEKEIQ